MDISNLVSRVLTVGAACLACLTLPACSGEVGEETTGATLENLTIEQYLISRGNNPEAIRITADKVWADEDAYYDKAELLDEIDFVGFEVDPSQTAQGYYYSVFNTVKPPTTQLLQAPRVAPVYYRFEDSVPEHWRLSFRQAAAIWANGSSTDCLSFTEGNGPGGASQITIKVEEAGTADDGGPAAGDAKLPTLLRGVDAHYIVGSRIRIDPSYRDVTDMLTRLKLALHEMGHTLGFKHPWQGSHIAGTAQNGNRDSCCEASYRTIMDYAPSTFVPSPDDFASLSIAFRPREVRNRFGSVIGTTCNFGP